jgi:hypothetical protein
VNIKVPKAIILSMGLYYAIIKHCNAELAYALELPKQHCEAQKELSIEKKLAT